MVELLVMPGARLGLLDQAAAGVQACDPSDRRTPADGPTGEVLAGAVRRPARRPVRAFREQAAILAVLLRGEAIAHDGPFYPTTVPAMPPPVTRPRPPLVIAAHGPMGLRAAARHADMWNCLGGQVYEGGPNPDRSSRRSLAEAVVETRRLIGRLDEACEEAGRDPCTLARSVLAFRPETDPFASLGAFDDFIGAYAGLDLEEITLYWPPLAQAFGEPPSAADDARFERIAAQRIATRPDALSKET